MTQSQPIAWITSWEQWEGRIVNARFPLRKYLSDWEQGACYLTEVNGLPATIKLLRAGAAQADAQVASWKLAASLSHPNLVRILQIGLWHADDEQDMHFAIEEHCEESLAEILRLRSLTAREAREMLAPALDSLKYLHALGIMHGEINPGNVLAAGDQLKLSTDSVRRPGQSRPHTLASPYDAPEKSAGTTSPSGDIWSLGITLFEALTGHLPPHGRQELAATLEKLPEPFDAIVAGCLKPDRAQRLSISAIRKLLDRSVEAVSEPQPIAQRDPKPIELPTPVAAPLDLTPPSVWDGKFVRLLAWADRQRFVIAASVIALLLMIAVELRLTHDGSKVSHATAYQKAHSIGASPIAGADSPRRSLVPDSPGAATKEVLPEISRQAKSTISGTVKVRVRVRVNAEGLVTQATLGGRSPSPYFARQALAAARQWVFLAPMHNGKPQPSQWILRFEYRKGAMRTFAQRAS